MDRSLAPIRSFLAPRSILTPFTLLVALLALAARWPPAPPLRAQGNPSIASVAPSSARTNVWAGQRIIVQFNQPMNRASVEAGLRTEPAIPGRFEWPDGDYQVELIPREPHAPGRSYGVTLDASIRDTSGRAVISQSLSWGFTVNRNPDAPRFSTLLPVQQITPAGKRGMPFQPYVPRATFNLTLYAVDGPGFVRRYTPLRPDKINPIDVAGLAVAAKWTQAVDAEAAPAELALPPASAPGLYVLEAQHPNLGVARTLLMFSDYALTAQVGPAGTSFWAARLPSGQPAPASTVTLYAADGRAVATTVGDAKGVARIASLGDAKVAIADIGGHKAMVGLDGAWYSQGYWSPRSAGYYAPKTAPRYAGHIHTDRPIYRPGHTVHYKATLRRMGTGTPAGIAAGTAVSVTVRDAARNLIRQTAPRTDAFGSIAGDLDLGDEVSLGGWTIEVVIDGQTISGAFKVEEYVKPDYAVEVETDKAFYLTGDTARVSVQADYYFGQPVADADVTVRIYRSTYGLQSPLLVRSGKLDATGAWSLSTPLNLQGAARETFSIEAEVTDDSRRPVYGQAAAPVHPAAFSLGLRNRRYGIEVGKTVEIDVTTMGHDGRPAAGRKVDFDVRAYQYPNGSQTVRTVAVTTGADGRAELRLDGLGYGWYDIRATARDDAGRTLAASTYAWLFSTSEPWYWRGGIEITADQDSYADGDTARLLIRSPVEGIALVTLEREGVINEIVVPVRGATPIDVPIKAAYAPNVNARVVIWEPLNGRSGNNLNGAEGRLLVASANLVVPAVDRRLQVDVTTDKSLYAPGEEVRVTLKVRDAAGQPADAQIALAAVDKAVLALAADASGDIFDAFWRPRLSLVGTHDSVRPSNWYAYRETDRSERVWRASPSLPTGAPTGGPAAPTGTPAPSRTAAAAPTSPPGTPAPGGAAPGAADAAPAVVPRREFRDTAYWNPAIRTGPDGEATIVFIVPDNLTTWSLLARAITVDTKAGQGEAEVIVSQAVIADPALPRFAVQGDTFVLDVLGRNYTAGAQDGSCALETPGLVQLDAGERSLALPQNATRVARWSVVASQVGMNTVKAKLITPAGSDAIEVPFDVQPFGVPERFSRAGATSDIAFEPFDLPFKAVPDDVRIEIRLTPSIASSIFEGAGELIGYPYGCVEQTMSKTLPNAVIGRLQRETGVVPPASLSELPAFMDVGIQKLYGFQHTDGSWGWWSGGQNLYLSAYVIQGLTLARQAGYAIDAGVLDRGLDYLARSVPSEPEPRMQAYAAFAMAEAGRGDAAPVRSLFEKRSRLDAFALAGLAMALDRTGRRDLALLVLDDLAAKAVATTSGIHWTMDRANEWGSWSWRSMASDETSTAMALLAFARIRPADPLAPRAVSWLLERRTGAGWQTTQTTAFALLALTDHVIASGDLRPDYGWAVQLDENVIASGRVGPGTRPGDLPPIVLTGSRLTPGPHALAIQVSGTGRLYYTVSGKMTLFYPRFRPTPADGFGVALKRDYLPVAGPPGVDGWHAGDLVNVRLTLTADRSVSYMIVEDMLPAGFEALNTRLATETGHAPLPSTPWRWWGYERKEIRDDKVSFFATQLPAGTHVFEYAARAVTPGTFAARPAEAYAMYRPDVWARSASDQVKVDAGLAAARPPLPGDLDSDCRLTGFDAALVADVWADASVPAGDPRDIDGDGRIDVADIALAGARVDSACGDKLPPLPDAGDAVRLKLDAPAVVGQFGRFDVTLVLDPAAGDVVDVGAWEATLHLPAGAFEVVGVEGAGTWLGGARRLGPVIDGDTVRLGGFRPLSDFVPFGADAAGTDAHQRLDSPHRPDGPIVLARLTLRARQAGDVAIDVVRAQALNILGGAHTVTADGVVISPVPWRAVSTVFVPWVERW